VVIAIDKKTMHCATAAAAVQSATV